MPAFILEIMHFDKIKKDQENWLAITVSAMAVLVILYFKLFNYFNFHNDTVYADIQSR